MRRFDLRLTAALVFMTPLVANAATYSVIHSFTGSATDGAQPGGTPLLNSGALYGTASQGGAHNAGVVYKLTPPASVGLPWTPSVLYSFKGGASDGSGPYDTLVADTSGALYGTTS